MIVPWVIILINSHKIGSYINTDIDTIVFVSLNHKYITLLRPNWDGWAEVEEGA